jgi:6-pyruvoyltetrahydropterin/6-carboxytetrahydropterin synthase
MKGEDGLFRTFIETRFSAAHRLIGYAGHCGRVHGHTWKVRVEVETDRINDIGISIDFKELKRLAESVIDRLDHQDINTVPPFDIQNPTAEHLSRYIYGEVKNKLPTSIRLAQVTVWESENHAVTYFERK